MGGGTASGTVRAGLGTTARGMDAVESATARERYVGQGEQIAECACLKRTNEMPTTTRSRVKRIKPGTVRWGGIKPRTARWTSVSASRVGGAERIFDEALKARLKPLGEEDGALALWGDEPQEAFGGLTFGQFREKQRVAQDTRALRRTPSTTGLGQSLFEAGYGAEGAEISRQLSAAARQSVETLEGLRSQIQQSRGALRRAEARNKMERLAILAEQEALYRPDEMGKFPGPRQRMGMRGRLAKRLADLEGRQAATIQARSQLVRSEREFELSLRRTGASIRNMPQLLGELVKQARIGKVGAIERVIAELKGPVPSELVFVRDVPFQYKEDWDDLSATEVKAVQDAGYTEKSYKELGKGRKPLAEGDFLTDRRKFKEAEIETQVRIRNLIKRRQKIESADEVRLESVPWSELSSTVRVRLRRGGITQRRYEALRKKQIGKSTVSETTR